MIAKRDAEPPLEPGHPERRLHPNPTHSRSLFRRGILGVPLQRKMNMLRLAWASLAADSVSEGEPAQANIPLPFFRQRMMRATLLLRGVFDRNDLGSKSLSRSADRLLKTFQKERSPCEPEPVPVYDLKTGNQDEFYERYVKLQRPVVIKGFGARAQGTWSIDSIVERFGHETVTLTDTGGSSYEGKIGDLESPAPNGGPFYMHNNNKFFLDDPERTKDLSLETWAQFVRRPAPKTVAMFAGVMPGTGTLMHSAGNMNTFMLLEGRKRWTLADPRYFLLLYPYISHTNNFQLSLITDAEAGDAWPLYRYCPRYTVDLEPSDCLFVPTWWYHATRNLTSRNLAVAIRWQPYLPGEVCTNVLFRLLDTAMNRVVAGVKGAHQDSTELIGSGAALSSWGLKQKP